MNPSSKDDFTEFGKLLKEKITQYEKSLHYAGFLEALLRDVCISCKCSQPQLCCLSWLQLEWKTCCDSAQRGLLC